MLLMLETCHDPSHLLSGTQRCSSSDNASSSVVLRDPQTSLFAIDLGLQTPTRRENSDPIANILAGLWCSKHVECLSSKYSNLSSSKSNDPLKETKTKHQTIIRESLWQNGKSCCSTHDSFDWLMINGAFLTNDLLCKITLFNRIKQDRIHYPFQRFPYAELALRLTEGLR